jgi:hypothetical protein
MNLGDPPAVTAAPAAGNHHRLHTARRHQRGRPTGAGEPA